ncbi:hypothetical protein EV200_101726 [Pedobacter psychrotolerans]|uniref:Uncharacterized protein n=1 Tax=Pedobacter psychrotolerans TaxID=1843235 RepID=A0A4R2HM39_9SPHI|nr:hypothetical protein EV200_101726 [Pedobacter psychrotolerans]
MSKGSVHKLWTDPLTQHKPNLLILFLIQKHKVMIEHI